MHRGAKSIFEPQRHKAGTKEHKVFFYVFLCFLPTIIYQQLAVGNLQGIGAFPAN